MPPDRIAAACARSPTLLEMEDRLGARAANLSPDDKQKISMGRGLVREDVAVIMFDEPLTVIDPAPQVEAALQAQGAAPAHRGDDDLRHPRPDRGADLRRPGRRHAGRRGRADRQPLDLFERPQHTFVGHFIGSPGMNVLPCEVRTAAPSSSARRSSWPDTSPPGRGAAPRSASAPSSSPRPPRHPGHRAQGRRHRPPRRRRGDGGRQPRHAPSSTAPSRSRARPCISTSSAPRPGSTPTAGWPPRRTADEVAEPEGLVLRPARPDPRRVQRADPADDRRQLLGAGDVREQPVLLARPRLVRGGAALAPLPRRARPAAALHFHHPAIQIPLGVAVALAMPRRAPGSRSAWC